MNQQIEITEDDFDWNHELNMPNRIVETMTPDEVNNAKRLKALVKSGCATPDEISWYTQIMMSYNW